MSEQRHTPHNVLVTGGAGFIGSNFVRKLIRELPSVRAVTLDALTYAGHVENLQGLSDPSRHTFIKGDIADAALVGPLLRDHAIDTVVHFAAETHVDRSIDGPAHFIQTNLVGTFTLLDAARSWWLETDRRRDARFHHVSTDEVFGALGRTDPAFLETTPYQPNSPYSASKAGADHLVRAFHHTYGLPVTITNCSNNYGPYQHLEKFIPTVISSCVAGRHIPVYGDGSNIRDWLYVEDHCDALLKVLCFGEDGRTYNVGGGHEQPNLDIARAICGVLDEFRPDGAPHSDLVRFVKDRPGHDWRYSVDSHRIRSELGWSPSETFETGLRKTVVWYLDRLDGAR